MGGIAFSTSLHKIEIRNQLIRPIRLTENCEIASPMLVGTREIAAQKTGPSSAKIKIQSKGNNKVVTLILDLESQVPYKIISLGFIEGS
ncbi:hypothetical protein MJD09_01770 [bacterium]|nr:hypothetical protein [bacterium]